MRWSGTWWCMAPSLLLQLRVPGARCDHWPWHQESRPPISEYYCQTPECCHASKTTDPSRTPPDKQIKQFIQILSSCKSSLFKIVLLLLNESNKYLTGITFSLKHSGLMPQVHSVSRSPWSEISLIGEKICWSNKHVIRQNTVSWA